jgi:hypothetical protein
MGNVTTPENEIVISGLNDNTELAKMFCQHYTTVSNAVPPSDTKHFLMQNRSSEVPHVETWRMANMLEALNTKKATGSDGLESWLLKEHALFLAEPMSKLFNECLSQGRFPTAWKLATIKPLPKTPTANQIADFRPISLTPILSKLLEKIIKEWLIATIGDKLDNRQYAYSKARSTTHALAEIIHAMSFGSEKGCVKVIAIDMSKAFDRVRHATLMSKLEALGCTGPLMSIICDFLRNRRIQTVVNNATSEPKYVYASVPQGCVLSPILFNVMTNDLRCPGQALTVKYADDLTLIKQTNLQDGMNEELGFIANWAEQNHMLINTKKTQVMTINFSRQRAATPCLVLNGDKLEATNSMKLLGMTLQEDLGWQSHVESIISKCSTRLHSLRWLKRSGVPSGDIEQLYYSMVRSVVEYGGCLLTNLTTEQSASLDAIQKQAEQLCGHELENLGDRRMQHLSSLMKAIRAQTEHPLHSFIIPSKSKRRTQYNFLVPHCKTNRTRLCFFTVGLNLL